VQIGGKPQKVKPIRKFTATHSEHAVESRETATDRFRLVPYLSGAEKIAFAELDTVLS
jgi:hypothetical protein